MGETKYWTTGARRPLALWLSALAMLTLACGSVAAGGETSTVDESGRGRGHTSRNWFDAELADSPTDLRVRFYGPDPTAGAECDEQLEVEVQYSESEVDVSLILYWDDNPGIDLANCPWIEQEATASLTEPLAQRHLVTIGRSIAMRLGDDGLEVVPESTPCGRVDCNTPSPTPAPCDGEGRRQAYNSIDGGVGAGGTEQCDGSFLIAGIDVGGGGCQPTESEGENLCARSKRAYFVARDGAWGVVTYGKNLSCLQVLHLTGIRFPEELCNPELHADD